jgi:hypothetical protein
MKENSYFKARDIRAVENPYEASFELADIFNNFSRSLKMNLKVLVTIFIYYSVVIMGIIAFNLLYGTNEQLNLFSVAFSIFMLCLTIISIKHLIESHIFLKDLGFSQELMMKIKIKVEKGNFNIQGEKELKVHDNPIKGLLDLIHCTSQYSKKIARTFKLIICFIMVWYIAGILFLSIQMYRFGLDIEQWKFDWLLPGGIDITVAVLATLLIILVRVKFEFARKRYEAIDYAITYTTTDIPKGETPIQRYKEFLTRQKGYEYLTREELWKTGAYFEAESVTNKGKVLIKHLKNVPKIGDIMKFRGQVKEKTGRNQLDRAVIIYKEEPRNPLSDEVYNHILENPIKLKKEICNIQLVMEADDGKYDFIPIISF